MNTTMKRPAKKPGLPFCALFFGLCLAILTKDNAAGIGYLILALVGVCLTKYLFGTLTRYHGILCVLIILSALSFSTTGSEPVHALDALTALLLLCALCARTLSVRGLVQTLFSPLTHLFSPVGDLRKEAKATDEEKKNRRTTFRQVILPGLVIAVPLFVIVFLLLRAADPVFAAMTDALIPDFDGWDVLSTILLFFSGFVCSYTFWREHRQGKVAESKERVLLPALTAMIYLVPVCVLYLVFCVIQLVVVLGHGLPAGLTYAEYVHEGFYQLTALAALNLLVFFLTERFFVMEKKLKHLLLLLSCCTGVLAFTALCRMVLYIGAYQLTFLRLFVLWFLVLLALLLVLLTRRIFRAGRLLPQVIVLSSVMVLVFSFLHPDALIARWNLSHGCQDPYYLTSLSSDAVPALSKDPELLSSWKENHEGQLSLYNESTGLQRLFFWNPSTVKAVQILTKEGIE